MINILQSAPLWITGLPPNQVSETNYNTTVPDNGEPQPFPWLYAGIVVVLILAGAWYFNRKTAKLTL
jgi:hypothetical protein